MTEAAGIVAWPENWPVYKQACFGSFNDRCDMLIGPCACGASHVAGEFEFVGGVLYRFGFPVQSHCLFEFGRIS